MAKKTETGFSPLDKSGFDVGLKSMVAAGKRLHAIVASMLLQCLWNNLGETKGERHNGVEFANKLHGMLPNGIRKDAVRAHLEKHGNMRFDTKAKAFVYRDNGKSWDYDVLSELDWNESKKEPEPVSMYDFDKLADQAISRMLKLQKQAIEEGIPVVHAERIKALVDALNAARRNEYTSDDVEIRSEDTPSASHGFAKQQERKQSVAQ